MKPHEPYQSVNVPRRTTGQAARAGLGA